MRRRRVILLGADGRLGSDLQRVHAAGAPFELVPLGRHHLDLAQPDALVSRFADTTFDVLVNFAAYHDTDAAEDDAALAFAVNGHAVRQLAEVCAGKGSRLVHISTDYVFGGDTVRRRPLAEDAPAAPVNVYGASKALGETLARRVLEDLVIVRVASLFGAPGANASPGNFVETIIRAGRERGALRVVDDQIMSPTFTADAAAAILKMLSDGCPAGTYHVVNTGAVSWFGFAASIVRRLRIRASVAPCRSDESGRRAVRPTFSALDNAKASDVFGPIAAWQDALGRYFRVCGHAEARPTKCAKPAAAAVRHERPFLFGANPTRDSCFQATKALYREMGNQGNVAFVYAIDGHLGPKLPVVGWAAPGPSINAGGDVGVIPAANQLGRHADFSGLAKRFEEVDIPLVMIGLGAQSDIRFTVPDIPPGTIDWLHRIVERASGATPNLAVRGDFTHGVLHRHGLADHAAVVGCPSLFINPSATLGRDIVARVRPPKRVAVVAGHQRWRHLAAIERSLGALVTQTNGSYIGQDPLELVMLTRGEARRMTGRDLLACRDYVCPNMPMDDFIRWSRRHGQTFFDAAAWMEHYRRFDFVVGTRIHGVMLALQAGVPALCLAHDSRTLELCQTMQVPHVLAQDHRDGLSLKQLLPLFDFDGAAFDANRRRLCARYVAFLEGNGLRAADWVRQLAADSSTVRRPCGSKSARPS